jgi:hypothetical protein
MRKMKDSPTILAAEWELVRLKDARLGRRNLRLYLGGAYGVKVFGSLVMGLLMSGQRFYWSRSQGFSEKTC